MTLKKYLMPAAALCLALAAAGCYNSTDKASSVFSEQPASSSVSASQADTQNPAAAAVVANFEDLKDAFASQGFTISNENAEGMKISFTAENDAGSVMVAAERFEDTQQTDTAYQSALENIQSEDYQVVSTENNATADLTYLINDYNSVYAYVGADHDTDKVYVFQEMMEGTTEACRQILDTLGFAAQAE